MPVIQFARTAQPSQVEDFPKDCDRSHPGALHVRPGATKTVTKAELEHLQTRKIPLHVVRAVDPAPKEPETAPEAPQAAPTASAPSAPSEPSSAPSGASGGDSEGGSGGKGSKKSGKGGK